MSIVNHVFLSPNEGEDYLMFLALSVPGKVSRCSASVLVLLASFLNSGEFLEIDIFYGPIIQILLKSFII